MTQPTNTAMDLQPIRLPSACGNHPAWQDEEIEILNCLLFTPRGTGVGDLQTTYPGVQAQTPFSVAMGNMHVGVNTQMAPAPSAPLQQEHSSGGQSAVGYKRSHVTLSPLGEGKRHQNRGNAMNKSSDADFKTLTATQCLNHIHKSFDLLTRGRRDCEPIRITTTASSEPTVDPRSVHNGWELRGPSGVASLGHAPMYTFVKQLPVQNVQQLMHQTWTLWTDPIALMRMYPTKKISLQILQRFKGDALVVQQETLPMTSNAPTTPARSIYMLFRIETKQGFTICARSLEIGVAQDHPVFHWISFSSASDQSGVTVEFGACQQTLGLVPREHASSYIHEQQQQPPHQQSQVGELQLAIHSHLLALLHWESAITTM